MLDSYQLLTIAGVLLLAVISPGPNFAIVTSTAMRGSRRAGILASLGLVAAAAAWAALALAGIGIVLTQVPWIYEGVRIVGALYLVWLGVRMFLGVRQPMPSADVSGIDGAVAFRNAFLVGMTNPKAIAFYGSIFSVMVPAHAPAWFYLAVVAIDAGISGSWYCGMALAFSHDVVRRAFTRTKTAVEATMGVVLIGLGGKLLLDR